MMSIAYGNNLFVGTGYNTVLTSPDGITWSTTTTTWNNSAYDVTFGNGLFVAVGAAFIRWSADGVTWSSTSFSSSVEFHGVAYGGNRFVAVGYISSSYYASYYSDNGSTWYRMENLPSGYNCGGVTYAFGEFICNGYNSGSSSAHFAMYSKGETYHSFNELGSTGFSVRASS